MVHAASDGRKTIRLQRPCDVSEIFGASPRKKSLDKTSSAANGASSWTCFADNIYNIMYWTFVKEFCYTS